MIASSSRGPRRSFSWRRPRKSSPLIREACLDLDGYYLAVRRALARGRPSSPASVRKWPAVTGASDQAGLLEYLPDGEGLEQVPVFGEGRGRGLSDLLRVRFSSHAITPESTRCTFGCLVTREPRGRTPRRRPVDEEDGFHELDVSSPPWTFPGRPFR